MWPLLSPEGLVRRLLASPRRLAKAGRGILTPDELDALHASSAGGAWSEADRLTHTSSEGGSKLSELTAVARIP